MDNMIVTIKITGTTDLSIRGLAEIMHKLINDSPEMKESLPVDINVKYDWD